MSDKHSLADVALALDGAAQEGARVRAAYNLEGFEASPEALAEVARSGRLLDRFLQDVDEALKQVFVAGLAYPDPELPDELGVLVERAERHGLGSAVEHLSRLRVLIGAILAERDLMTRHKLAQDAWNETHRFLAWLRLFRGEHDFLTVQGKLAAESTGEVVNNRASYPTRSATVWPLGMELHDGRLLVFAQDVDTGRYVMLRDQISEFEPHNPLGSVSISRLFQDSIVLRRVMGALVRLEDHPVVTKTSAWLFRPAFQTTPKVLPVAANFREPEIPEIEFDGENTPRVGRAIPSRMTAYAHLNRRGLHVRTANHASARLKFDGALKLNLTKLLFREAQEKIELPWVVLPREDELLALSLTTAMDGRVFPVQDPILFRTSPQVVVRRAWETAAALDKPTLGTLWLKAMSHALADDADSARLAELTAGLLAFVPHGVAAHARLAWAGTLTGQTLRWEGARQTVEATLALANAADSDPVDLARLALALGKPQGALSSSDLRLLDGNAIFYAVWMALELDLVEPLGEPLRALWTKRYKGELVNPSVGDLCARALLIAALEIAPEGEARPADFTEPALRFLYAHLTDINQGKRAVAPEFEELLMLGETVAWLTNQPRVFQTVTRMGYGAERLLQPVAEAMFFWWVGEPEDRSDASMLRAGDALALAFQANLQPWLLC
jgi:hypothetical protein